MFPMLNEIRISILFKFSLKREFLFSKQFSVLMHIQGVVNKFPD